MVQQKKKKNHLKLNVFFFDIARGRAGFALIET